MKLVTVTALDTGLPVTYRVPSVEVAEEYAERTKGVQWDPVERKNVVGSLPMVWERVG